MSFPLATRPVVFFGGSVGRCYRKCGGRGIDSIVSRVAIFIRREDLDDNFSPVRKSFMRLEAWLFRVERDKGRIRISRNGHVGVQVVEISLPVGRVETK